MSSSNYCQGLQSCLEPSRLVDQPRVLRLTLSPPKSNISRSPSPRNPVPFDSDCDTETNKDSNKPDEGGWSFLQSLDGTSKITNDEANNNDEVYIPPSVKRSSSMLNEKSLEMCTESLGSETGTDVSDSSDEMTLTSPDTNVKHDAKVDSETYKETPKLRTRNCVMKRSASFPPPLSSMSGSTNVQVRPHREGGRLVLEAVSLTACRTYFQAERVNGRLKLHMLRNCSPKCKNKEACVHVDDNEKARNGVEEAESIVEDEYEDIDGDDDGDDDDYIDDGEVRGEELEENNGEDEGEMGMEKFAKAMSSRCMEGGSCDGKALLDNKNWETYCVAS